MYNSLFKYAITTKPGTGIIKQLFSIQIFSQSFIIV